MNVQRNPGYLLNFPGGADMIKMPVSTDDHFRVISSGGNFVKDLPRFITGINDDCFPVYRVEYDPGIFCKRTILYFSYFFGDS